jgi:CelD/BcsL family acetyltransferase involved in cellulose biosynthesis
VARPQDSNRLATLDYIETARISLNGSFEDYWNGRGKNLRHNMKRQRNRLEREGVRIGFEVLSQPQEMEQGVGDYGRLESAGWKSAQGTAVEHNNQQGRFYRDLLERYAATGEARCYRLYFGDQLVASDLCVSGFGTLVILKTTHDEECKGYSPGQLLHRQEVPECFAEDGLASLEFYGKVMDWHRRWTSEVRRMYHVNFYAKPVLSVAHKLLSRFSQRDA